MIILALPYIASVAFIVGVFVYAGVMSLFNK